MLIFVVSMATTYATFPYLYNNPLLYPSRYTALGIYPGAAPFLNNHHLSQIASYAPLTPLAPAILPALGPVVGYNRQPAFNYIPNYHF